MARPALLHGHGGARALAVAAAYCAVATAPRGVACLVEQLIEVALKQAVVCLCLIVAVACGGSPTAPTSAPTPPPPPTPTPTAPNVAGTYRGAFFFSFSDDPTIVLGNITITVS